MHVRKPSNRQKARVIALKLAGKNSCAGCAYLYAHAEEDTRPDYIFPVTVYRALCALDKNEKLNAQIYPFTFEFRKHNPTSITAPDDGVHEQICEYYRPHDTPVILNSIVHNRGRATEQIPLAKVARAIDKHAARHRARIYGY